MTIKMIRNRKIFLVSAISGHIAGIARRLQRRHEAQRKRGVLDQPPVLEKCGATCSAAAGGERQHQIKMIPGEKPASAAPSGTRTR
jgi:hypothetical protein